MAMPDLNLLVTLDVLLAEGSVARAAKRLRLSPSAMSRALGRLREATGDPLLVRAGRGLVPTPRALAVCERQAHLCLAARARPGADRFGPEAARAGARDRDDRRRVCDRAGAGPGVRPHRQRPRTTHRRPAGGHA